jgi:hypothetical protein
MFILLFAKNISIADEERQAINVRSKLDP